MKAEAALTAYALALPETDCVPWGPKRVLRVKTRTFAIFGGKDEPRDALTILVKLPVSFDMAQELSFVRPSTGWYLQHKWAFVHFGPKDDILAEMPTLKGWVSQSYRAMAPKKLAKLVS
jgi:predicted DNA-binding protein (MmcQ/YjbR family)